MVRYQGNFEGEIKLEAIKFSQYYTKKVMKNNQSSGKILLPSDLIDEEVVVLLPIKKLKLKKQKRVNKK